MNLKDVVRKLRHEIGLTAGIIGSVPGSLFVVDQAHKIEIPRIRTVVKIPDSIEAAFQADFENVGGDLQRAISKFAVSREQQI